MVTNPRIKTVGLLKPVGLEGRSFLQSVGFDVKLSCYKKVFGLLNDQHGRKENIFNTTQKIVLVKKSACEENTDYLVRTRRLSCDTGFGDAEALRRHYIYQWLKRC